VYLASLVRHLIITSQDKILFYSHWRKWVFLARHAGLLRATTHNNWDQYVTFDTLINARRMRTENFVYSCGITRVSQNVLIMNIFCFHQNAHGKSKERSATEFSATRIQILSAILISRKIESEDLQTDWDGSNWEWYYEYVAEFIRLQSEDWKHLFESCLPFVDWEMELHKMLEIEGFQACGWNDARFKMRENIIKMMNVVMFMKENGYRIDNKESSV